MVVAPCLITSQLPVPSWHDVIGEPTLGDAILDSIAHNAYRLELDDPSMRKLKAGEATTRRGRLQQRSQPITSRPREQRNEAHSRLQLRYRRSSSNPTHAK